MRRHALALGILFLLLSVTHSIGQRLVQKLTNLDIIDMVSLGFSDDVIIDKIHASDSSDFDTSVNGLKVLKANKVSDAVIRVMIDPHPMASALRDAASSSAGTSELPSEQGMYVLEKGRLAEIEPEIVGWQTGGVIKEFATLGWDKGHVNGKIMTPSSHTRLASPQEFVIRTAEGTSATEYQLLRLYKKGNRREFRAMTGGVFHAKGGSERTALTFVPVKIAPRTWRIRLTDLQDGEYGFLPPGVSAASISASGKMYTFAVIDAGTAQRSQSDSDTQNERAASASAATITLKTVAEGSIGVVSDGNPRARHDGVPAASVKPGSPAEQAGIKPGDVILAINDRYLFTGEQLRDEIRSYKPGERIAVRYRHNSRIYDTEIEVVAAY